MGRLDPVRSLTDYFITPPPRKGLVQNSSVRAVGDEVSVFTAGVDAPTHELFPATPPAAP